MIYRSRVVFTVGALAVASAAAATIPWQTWKPVTACLLCGVQDSGEAVVVRPTDAARDVGSGFVSSHARSSASTYAPDSVSTPTAETKSLSRDSSSSRFAAAPRGWQPWGSGSESNRFASSGFSGPSAPQGGLWRLMSLHPHHGAGSAASSTIHTVAHGSSPAASRPVKAPPAPHHSPSPSSGSSPSSPASGSTGTNATSTTSSGDSGSAMAGVPPTDPFHEHQTQPPDPFHGPGFDPGAPAGGPGSIGGGGKGLGGGRVSAAPEPGSILLLSTGLLGIFGTLRKRRLI